MRAKLIGLAAALAATMAPGAAGAAELLTNGGFERGDFSGWTVTQSAFNQVVGTSEGFAPHGGAYQANLGQIFSIGTLSQTVNTVIGESYAISFWLANRGGSATQLFEASFGQQTLGVQEFVPTFFRSDPTPYTLFTFTGLATAARTELTFRFRNDPTSFLLDDVSVQDAAAEVPAVPEPAAWMLLMLGFGAVGAALRVRPRTGSLRPA